VEVVDESGQAVECVACGEDGEEDLVCGLGNGMKRRRNLGIRLADVVKMPVG
jgi:hypothetical protein